MIFGDLYLKFQRSFVIMHVYFKNVVTLGIIKKKKKNYKISYNPNAYNFIKKVNFIYKRNSLNIKNYPFYKYWNTVHCENV